MKTKFLESELVVPDEDQLPLEDTTEEKPGKKRRPSVVSHDIRTFFDGSRPAAAPPRTSSLGGSALGDGAGFKSGATSESAVLEAFKLSRSAMQDVPERPLVPAMVGGELGAGGAPRSELAGPVALDGARSIVKLLSVSTPLMPSGQAIFGQLPASWFDVTGRSDALGARCFFAARRHEHSVFEQLSRECLVKVPLASSEWQPALHVPSAKDGSLQDAPLADEEPWVVQLHPARKELRVLVRPGVLLQRMLRRGSALPAARFTWRVVDVSASDARGAASVVPDARRQTASPIGEFNILSNVEDAAHTQPPDFAEWPLRREQLRSLGWMMSQEQRRREPFVTELRESAPFPDAPHWHLEGCLRCEYTGVKGGVLADAIGYGKTACTIGLVNCTTKLPPPLVPSAFSGFIPSRATLVLAPTNLHSQWLAEIVKFTGKTLKVLSVPTCAQLKRLTVRDLVEADVVVATYRIFYSSPYLRRLQEVARTQQPAFSFTRLPGGGNGGLAGGSAHHKIPAARAIGDWARSYRGAFDALREWARGLPDAAAVFAAAVAQEPVTPAKVTIGGGPPDGEDPFSSDKAPARLSSRKRRGAAKAGAEDAATPETSSSKRRRLLGKQAVAEPPVEWSQPHKASGPATAFLKLAAADVGEPTRFVPLEVFWWRRVVCDEFHELLSRYPPAQVAVELFHGDYKWGLSGTPPCQTLAQIRKAAGFLGVQLPTASAEESGGEAPRQVAQEWLDAFVRRNTAELPPLEEEERIVPVYQTPKERALYLALTGEHASTLAEQPTDSAQAALEEHPELQMARRSASGLLKLCSHFCTSDTGGVTTAEDECRRQLALREERVRGAEREAKALAERAALTATLVRHFEPYWGGRPVLRSDCNFLLREKCPSIAARLRFLGLTMVGTKKELLERLMGPEAEGDVEVGGALAEAAPATRAAVLRPDFNAKRIGKASKLAKEQPPVWSELEAAAAGSSTKDALPTTGEELVLQAVRRALAANPPGQQPQQTPGRCTRLRAHLEMPRWPGAPGAANEALEQANWEWLRDHDNASKLDSVIDAWKAEIDSCARQLVSLKHEAENRLTSLASFRQSLDDPQTVAAAADSALELQAQLFAKYGSKIEALVGHVQRLRREQPTCKVICFVQWEDLKRKVGAALEEFGVEHISLMGSVWARRAALTRFQYEESGPRMLLLSLEESASGTNLTAANHVIIVHPMEAATKEEAVAFEMQAVGRVRRPGQTKKIHIWRFVTMGTIEQQITEEHQQELWERQRAKIAVSAPAPLGDDVLQSDDDEDHDAGADEAMAPEGVAATQRYVGAGAAGAPAPPPAAAWAELAAAGPEDDTLPASAGSWLGEMLVREEDVSGASPSVTDCLATQAY